MPAFKKNRAVARFFYKRGQGGQGGGQGMVLCPAGFFIHPTVENLK